jgi:AraC-like DNA-binding protein
MHYQEYHITAPLRPFVKVIWSMESGVSIFNDMPMRILPDTCVELVIHFNDPYQTTFSDNTSSIQHRSFVVAQMKSFIDIQPHGKPGLIAVRFTAHGAYHFFGMPMKELANCEIDLHCIWKKLAAEIEERVALAPNNTLRSRVIQRYLSMQLQKNGNVDKVVNYCLHEISNSKGQISMEELACKTGVSNRQLLRRFNNCVGLPPKEFAKITKFINALNYLRQFPEKNLTDAGYDCGYYDQAHFIHDFKGYSGLTPGEYLLSTNVVY